VSGTGRELGEGVRRERKKGEGGRRALIGGGVKNDTWVPQPMISAGKLHIE